MSMQDARRPLVLVVGTDSTSRSRVARELISNGSAVILCAGPPACPLLRGTPCVLVEGADVAVMMPGNSRAPEVLEGLALCSCSARHVVHAGGEGAGSAPGIDLTTVSVAVREAIAERAGSQC